MALSIDGFAVLATIGRKPDLFPDIRSEAAKAAQALLAKQLKAKTLTVTGLRGIEGALGRETFSLVLDALSDADVKSLATRLDKHHPEIKDATAGRRRRHIVALAAGAEPAEKPKKAAAAKRAPARKPGKAPVERAISSKAMAAVWDGRNIDEDEAEPAKKPAKAAGRARAAKGTR